MPSSSATKDSPYRPLNRPQVRGVGQRCEPIAGVQSASRASLTGGTRSPGNPLGRSYGAGSDTLLSPAVRAAGVGETERFGLTRRCYGPSDPRPDRSCSLTLLSIMSAYLPMAGSLVGVLALRLSPSTLLLSCSSRACSSCSNVASLWASCWATLSFRPSSVPSRS